MSNSGFERNQFQRSNRNNFENNRSNSRNRFGGNKENSGFRIRLSENEMKAAKVIQEKFQLKSTVAVLGFSVRTLSEMIKDEKLIGSITEYAKNNKNSSPNRQLQNPYEEKTKTAPDPFARPVKSTSTEEIQSSEVEEDGK